MLASLNKLMPRDGDLRMNWLAGKFVAWNLLIHMELLRNTPSLVAAIHEIDAVRESQAVRMWLPIALTDACAVMHSLASHVGDAMRATLAAASPPLPRNQPEKWISQEIRGLDGLALPVARAGPNRISRACLASRLHWADSHSRDSLIVRFILIKCSKRFVDKWRLWVSTLEIRPRAASLALSETESGRAPNDRGTSI